MNCNYDCYNVRLCLVLVVSRENTAWGGLDISQCTVAADIP